MELCYFVWEGQSAEDALPVMTFFGRFRCCSFEVGAYVGVDYR